MLATSSVFHPGQDGGAWLDQILIEPRLGLVAVADAPAGGEHRRAGIRMALDALRRHLERHDELLDRFRRHPADALRQQVLKVLDEGFGRAAKEVYAYARRAEGLRVTMDVLLLLQHEAFVGHLGDGRVYLVRRGLVHQLTVDHSRGDHAGVIEALGERTDELLGADPGARALGAHPAVVPESLCMELSAEDRFLVCSARLHRGLPEHALHQQLIGAPLDRLGPELAALAGDAAIVAGAAQLGEGAPSEPEWARRRLAVLAPVPLFAHCSEVELRSVAQATRPRQFTDGAVIFEQGAVGRELYLVIAGHVRIERDGRQIARLGPCSNFGEMALLDEPVRSASAIAEGTCELMVIPQDAFIALLRQNPKLAVKILWNMLLRLSSHLRTTSRRLATLEHRLAQAAFAPTPPGPSRREP